jgi:hypothetical protein
LYVLLPLLLVLLPLLLPGFQSRGGGIYGLAFFPLRSKVLG